MEGKLVRIRAYEKSDLDALMKWVNDEEVTRNLAASMIYPLSRAAEESYLSTNASGGSPDCRWAIETLAGDYLGGISLMTIDWINRSAQVGIVIGIKQHWGKGYGTDAMRVLLRFAFEKMNLHRVWLNAYDFNTRGIKSYEKCGFQREGVQREYRFLDGRYHDSVLMAILEREYSEAAKTW
ncbi:MAG TPA: GNAT family protein [Candidatus Binataceae bacterium]|nr:GNAT family protein [Candidatus Binataceae bacterium]